MSNKKEGKGRIERECEGKKFIGGKLRREKWIILWNVAGLRNKKIFGKN